MQLHLEVVRFDANDVIAASGTAIVTPTPSSAPSTPIIPYKPKNPISEEE